MMLCKVCRYLKRQDGGWQEQQDGEPHQLQDESDPPGLEFGFDIVLALKSPTSRTLVPSLASSRPLTNT